MAKASEGNALFSEGKYELALTSYSQDVVSMNSYFTLGHCCKIEWSLIL